jgi:PAS domain S-box-containing protein
LSGSERHRQHGEHSMGRALSQGHRTPRSDRLREALDPALAAVVPTLIAFAIESVFWATIPRTLLFTAAVIVSSWMGGFKSGIGATVLSAALFFNLMQPASPSLATESRLYITTGLFLAVGVAISVFHSRLKKANQEVAIALKRSRQATTDLMRVRAELEAANARLELKTRDLNESKSLLQAIFDHSPSAIVVKNLDGEFLLTNRQFQQAFGLTVDDLRGKTDFDVIPPSDAERHRAIDREAIETGGPVTHEESGLVRGMSLTFLETVFPLRDELGNTFGVCWIGTEISDIKRAEQALEHTAADLKEAQRVAHIGSWVWDLQTDATDWSEELFRIHGLDPSGPIPTFQEFQRLLTPESRDAVNAALEHVEHGGDSYELDLEILRPDGTHRWVSVRGEPIKDRSGQLIAVRGTSQDITQLKQLQRMKEEWMSVIAHDLRQPIGVIKMSAELLPDLHSGKMSQDESVITERIRSAVKGLARMVDDLLDMSRIEAHRLSLERAWVDPCAVVRQSLAGLKHVTGASHVTITESKNVSRVFVDLVRFEQIFGNLISNAVKHGETGGDINVRVSQLGPDVEIAVTNHGRGINPEDVPRLFSRFGRSSSAHGAAVPGLGLGLYIAKGLVEAHGGRMWVNSVPGKTTTFHFTLPGQAPAKEAA